MEDQNDIFVTSRSETPSIINIDSKNKRVFSELPDIIQEAIVSTEFASPNHNITRVKTLRVIRASSPHITTQPLFYIRPRTDSGVSMPDLTVDDEKFLSKYGPSLTANFADIKAHGEKAFFRKLNPSSGEMYSLCTCATGYIWVSATVWRCASDVIGDRDGEAEGRGGDGFDDLEVQIGTFALRARAITTIEIPCRFKYKHKDGGDIASLCSTVLGKYLRFRMMGQQYENATETAVSQTRKQFVHTILDPARFEDLDGLLRKVCLNAPLPPTSDVSLISRSMITGRWYDWREKSVLRKRYSWPKRIWHCVFKVGKFDSIRLLSGRFKGLECMQKDGFLNSAREGQAS